MSAEKEFKEVQSFKVFKGGKSNQKEKFSGNIISFTPLKEDVEPKGCEVYPFTTREELKAMLDYFDNRINNATTPTNRKIARRDKLLFVVGVNVGLRGSDLTQVKWSFFFDDDMNFHNGTKVKPIKTRNKNKYVDVFFNDEVKSAVNSYLEYYPITKENLDDCVFFSRKKGKPMTRASIGDIIKDGAVACNLKHGRRYNSHSLRKTFGYTMYHNSSNKPDTLTKLMQIFNHSSQSVTLAYIGIELEEMEQMYYENSIFGDLSYKI